MDDSVVARSFLGKILSGYDDMEVVAKVANIISALDYLRGNKVDFVLLDNEMPGKTGIEALPELIALAQGAYIVMLSGNCSEGSEAAVRALALGASDVITKPSAHDYNKDFSEGLIRRLTRLKLPQNILSSSEITPVARPVRPQFRMTCLGLGSSTGGIHALGEFFSGIKQPLGVPILITQHLPASFIPYFAKQLERMTAMPVHIGAEGMRLMPDMIYVAPGENNMLCRRRGRDIVEITLSNTIVDLQPMPAVDPMLQAMAECYGSGAAAAILTGMGRDGTIGAQQIVHVGGIVIAQDEASSVVWGMPGSIARAGLASALLPAHQMCGFLKQYTRVSL
ncbi:MAG: chemotaxis protein CheB [Sphingobium sp.]